MEDHRNMMASALKNVLVPALRARDFKGSFPHFYRAGSNRTDFLSIQFHSAGGSFIVEIATHGPNSNPMGRGEDLPVSRLNTTYFAQRLRLGSNPAENILDHWFEFSPRNYDAPHPPQPDSHYEHIAAQVVHLLDSQAEGWWSAS